MIAINEDTWPAITYVELPNSRPKCRFNVTFGNKFIMTVIHYTKFLESAHKEGTKVR